MMLGVLGTLLGTTPFVVALLIQRATNLPKVSRNRQYPLPFIAVAYVIVALVLMYTLNDVIDSLLRFVFGWAPFLRGLYSTTWQYVIENTAIIAGFVVLKAVLNRVFDRTFRGGRFIGSSIVGTVYALDEPTGLWFVRPSHASLRLYMRVFWWASAALAVAFIALADAFSGWPGFSAIAFPAVAALVIGECSWAIDGVTRVEFENSISSERDRANRIVNYAALRDVFTETFPDSIIDDGMELASSDVTRTHDRLVDLAQSPDDSDQITAVYFERVKSSGRLLDANLLDVTAGLMAGRSALINNPFYQDLGPYLLFPAYYRLLQQHKCLIVCGRDTIVENITDWARQGLEEVTGIPELWKVQVLGRDAPTDLDVGILRFADIHNLDLIAANDDFLRDVRFVVLAEPSRMLATGQLGLSIVLDRCGGGDDLTFAAFDRNHDGLVDALSHLLKADITDVIAAEVPAGVTSEIVWRTDHESTHARVLPAVSRYLGMAPEIAALALKYHVSHVDWLGSDAFPVHDAMWIAGQYYRQINTFAKLDISQHALTEAFSADANPWHLEVADHRFLIVEDEIHNVFESIRLYSTRAREQGFVNLISEDYLLRDYMIANREIFLADPKAIPSIVPDYARTERNITLRLMLQLRTFGMAEAELAREFELSGLAVPPLEPTTLDERHPVGWEPPVVQILRELIAVHTGVKNVPLRWMRELEGITDDGREIFRRFVQLDAGSGLDALAGSLRAAYFFVEDEAADREYVGSALYGLVHQLFLPGQFIAHAGKHYEVRSIGDDAQRGGVVLRRAADHIHDRRTYRPLRRFAVSDIDASIRPGSAVVIDGTQFSRVLARIVIESEGYLEQRSRSSVADARRVEVGGIPSRRYVNKELLRVRMPDVPAEVRRTIAYVLNEVFVTVFPHSYPYVVALTTDADAEWGDLLSPLATDSEDDDCIYIVEDSMMDLGLLVAVERNWRRLMQIVTDYLLWRETPPSAQGSAAGGAVAFPGDTPEDVAERARAAAEQDAGAPGRARPPRKTRWWHRLIRHVRGWFTRKAPDEAAGDAAPVSPAAPVPVPVPSAPEGWAGSADVAVPGDFSVELDVPAVPPPVIGPEEERPRVETPEVETPEENGPENVEESAADSLDEGVAEPAADIPEKSPTEVPDGQS